MKKQSSTLLLGSLVLTLAACSNGGSSNNTGASTTSTTTAINKDITPNTNNPTPNSSNSSAPTTSNSGNNIAITQATPSLQGNNLIRTDFKPTTQIDKFKVKPVAKELEAQVQKVVENTNKLRAEKGLPPLRYDEKLSAFAQRRAEQIVDRFSHSLPDSELKIGSEVKAGENIAAGANNADEVGGVFYEESIAKRGAFSAKK